MPEEIKIPVRNIELAGLRWNAGSKQKILALHGWLDNAESFTPLAELLPEHDIVALDFPGHGHSDHRPAGEILHYIDYIADVRRTLEKLNWGRCLLLGHSMGAGVASVFASAFSSILKGLICLDGLGPITSNADELSARLTKSVNLNLNSRLNTKTVYQYIDQAIEARLKAGDLSKASAMKLVNRNIKQTDNGFTWRSDSRLRFPSMYYLSEQQACAYLKNILVPTLIIRPVDSAYRAQAVLKQRAGLVKNLTWCEVPGSHHVHMDHPDRIIEPVNRFISTLPETD